MRQHPLDASHWFASGAALRPALDGGVEHCEQSDGMGYLYGLAGA
jgi:hypothetical protein